MKRNLSLSLHGWSGITLRNDFLCVFSQGPCLWQQFKRLRDLRVTFGAHLQTFFLPERVYENLALYLRPNPIIVLDEFTLSVRNFFFIQELAEFLHHRLINFE